MPGWFWVLGILGLVVLLHWFIYVEWRHRAWGKALNLLGRAVREPRSLLVRDEALMDELHRRVQQLSASSPEEQS